MRFLYLLPLLISAPALAQDGFHLIEVPENYRLVWHDEFDGNQLDSAAWSYEVHPKGWANNELQTYVDGFRDDVNVTEVADGVLTIRAYKEGDDVYSARLNAKVKEGWQYGIFEARIKLPKGRGTWPAFWMKPVHGRYSWPKCGEIDIMEEVGYRPDYTTSAIHCGAYNHTKSNQKAAEIHTEGVEDDFHVYRLEWTPDSITTSVDGRRVFKYDNDGKSDYMTWPFERPFYIILNLAWGGSWGGMKGTDDFALPAEMKVDYVRVFQKTNP